MKLKINPQIKPILNNLVDQIKKNESHVIQLILFGSQANMSANESSDIDLLVIIDESPPKGKKVHEQSDISEYTEYRLQTWCDIKDMINGKNTDVVVETPNTIKQHGKIPGTVQYYAIREGIVLYERDNSDQLIGNVDNKIAGHNEQTEYWIAKAKSQLKDAIRFDNHILSCPMIYNSINSSIKAMLTYEHTNYEFMRDLDKMNKLLLNKFDYDFSRISTWRGSFKSSKTCNNNNNNNKVTDQDIKDGITMAAEIYNKVENKYVIKN